MILGLISRWHGSSLPPGKVIKSIAWAVPLAALVFVLKGGILLTLAAGRYWLAILIDTTTSLNVMPQTGIANYIGVADLVNANGKRFYLPSTPYASGLVDMTSQTFTYQNGVGPVWMGLKAQ